MNNNKLILAKQILVALAFIFIVSAIAIIFIPCDGSTALWNFTTNALPSIAFLVISFYFGNNNNRE